MERFLLYSANAKTPQYFAGENHRTGKLLFVATKTLALVLTPEASRIWTEIISERTGHKPLAESVPVLSESRTKLQPKPKATPEYLTVNVRSERLRPEPMKPASRMV
jgi:hypothetical protein